MHDRNGTELKLGDIVMVSPQADYCNVTIKSTEGRRPDGARETVSAINTGVLTLLKRAATVVLLLLVSSSLWAQTTSPQVDTAEILRRGDMVTRAGDGIRAGVDVAISDAIGAPADDSGRWFITVITQRGCQYCDKLKADFVADPNLKAFANLRDPKESWSHFNIYSIEDETQKWRWKDIKFQGFPTILVQPPRNRQFGDPATVVMQRTGYDGDAKKLATGIRDSIVLYVKKLSEKQEYVRSAVEPKGHAKAPPSPPSAPPASKRGFRATASDDASQEVAGAVVGQVGVNPPFTVPSQQPPTVPSFPIDFPPQIPPQSQPQQVPQLPNLGGLLMQLLGGLLAGTGTTNLLLLIVAGLAVIRTFRKATGQKLLLDDASFDALVNTLKQVLGQPTTPTTPKAP